MKKTELSNTGLLASIVEMARGVIDADITGTLPTAGRLLKMRISPKIGKGKGTESRVIVATNLGSRWFFTFGFEKKDKGNLAPNERLILAEQAEYLLTCSDAKLTEHLEEKNLEEIPHAHN